MICLKPLDVTLTGDSIEPISVASGVEATRKKEGILLR